MNKGKILVNGSVVLDTIFEEELFGGTGANIAYGLGKLKASPLFFSLAGQDFKKDFHPHLKKNGVDVRVCVDEQGWTGRFSLIINEKGEEVSSWQANIYKKANKISLTQNIEKEELQKVSVAIFSPGTPASILRHISEFRLIAPKATVIFDPGQEIYNFSKKALQKCIDLSDIFILNEIEYKEVEKILGKDPKKNIRDQIIIETKGGKGSVIFAGEKTIKVNAFRPKHILDLTGAGDAYRAGLVFGLWKGFSLIKACALGARLATKNIGYIGGQKY